MARIRTIKPSFFRSQEMADLPLTARLTYIGLWTYVDDAGRGVDDPRIVKGDLWLLDDKHTVRKVAADLDLLAQRGHIERYEVDGRRYFQIPAWAKHQRINRPTPSLLPPPPLPPDSVSPHGTLSEPSHGERKGREREGKGGSSSPSAKDDPVRNNTVSDAFTTGSSAPTGAEPDDAPPLDEETVQRNIEQARAARAALKLVGS